MSLTINPSPDPVHPESIHSEGSAVMEVSVPQRSSNEILQGISSAVVPMLEQFLALTQVPRPSHQERLATAHIVSIAKQQGWPFKVDMEGNVVVSVPGKGAGVDARPIALQSHLDMVCVPKSRDFFSEKIVVERVRRDIYGIEQDSLVARGSSLGADNGIGVAAALAVALHPELNHPPLELVFTTNEEDGMSGAKALGGDSITTDWLINLDSEEQDTITVSSAGARDLRITIPFERIEPSPGTIPIHLQISGLSGGHSGIQVHEGRGNANIVLFRVLNELAHSGHEFSLAVVEGGEKRNALCPAARAVLWCRPEDVPQLQTVLAGALENEGKKLSAQWSSISGRIAVLETPTSAPNPFSQEFSRNLINCVAQIPDGVLSWSQTIPNLVETSSTMSVVATNGRAMDLTVMTRSSRDGAAEEFQNEITGLLHSLHPRFSVLNEYVGWPADPHNPLLDKAIEVFRDIHGKEPRVVAVHAGLECGLFRRALPHLKMISIGPDIVNPHSPNEAVGLGSLEPFWRHLTGVLERLSVIK